MGLQIYSVTYSLMDADYRQVKDYIKQKNLAIYFIRPISPSLAIQTRVDDRNLG